MHGWTRTTSNYAANIFSDQNTTRALLFLTSSLSFSHSPTFVDFVSTGKSWIAAIWNDKWKRVSLESFSRCQKLRLQIYNQDVFSLLLSLKLNYEWFTAALRQFSIELLNENKFIDRTIYIVRWLKIWLSKNCMTCGLLGCIKGQLNSASSRRIRSPIGVTAIHVRFHTNVCKCTK